MEASGARFAKEMETVICLHCNLGKAMRRLAYADLPRNLHRDQGRRVQRRDQRALAIRICSNV